MSSKKKFSLIDRIKSIGYATEGIVEFFTSQHNALIQGVAAIVVVALGFIYDIAITEWCFLIIAIAMVIVAEMLNTAIEYLTNIASPQISKKAKVVKDIAAGGVLVAAIASLIIGVLIFLPKMFV